MRTLAIFCVVFVHWLLLVRPWNPQAQRWDAIDGVWDHGWGLLASVFAWVMPAFFFVAAALSYQSYTRNPDLRRFLAARLWRLLVPLFVFLGVLVGLEVVLRPLHTPGCSPGSGLHCVPAPALGALWFLFYYVPLVALTPALIRLWRTRIRLLLPAACLVFIAGSDLVHFNSGLRQWHQDITPLVFWSFFWFLGFLYGDRSLFRVRRRYFAALILVCAAVIVWGIGFGPYDDLINRPPLGLTYVAAAVGAIIGTFLLRDRIISMAQSRPATQVLKKVEPRTYSIFLYHGLAVAGVYVLLVATGVTLPDDTTGIWLAFRPLFLILPAVVLLGLLYVFGRVEDWKPPRWLLGQRASVPVPTVRASVTRASEGVPPRDG